MIKDGEMILILRKKLELSQEIMSEGIMSRNHLSNIERGNVDIDSSKLFKLYKRLVILCLFRNLDIDIDFEGLRKITSNKLKLEKKNFDDFVSLLSNIDSSNTNYDIDFIEDLNIEILTKNLGFIDFFLFYKLSDLIDNLVIKFSFQRKCFFEIVHCNYYIRNFPDEFNDFYQSIFNVGMELKLYNEMFEYLATLDKLVIPENENSSNILKLLLAKVYKEINESKSKEILDEIMINDSFRYSRNTVIEAKKMYSELEN